MTANRFEYTLNQTARRFWQIVNPTVKRFWHTASEMTGILWESVVQHTDARLPIRIRKHWIVLLFSLLGTASVSIVTLWLSSLVTDPSWKSIQWFLWCVALAAVLYFAWRALEWSKEVLTVTSDRFEVEKGIIYKVDNTIMIEPLTRVEFHRPLLGWMLGYVTFKLVSPGQDHAVETFEHLPKQFKPVIDDLIRNRRRRAGQRRGVGNGAALIR